MMLSRYVYHDLMIHACCISFQFKSELYQFPMCIYFGCYHDLMIHACYISFQFKSELYQFPMLS